MKRTLHSIYWIVFLVIVSCTVSKLVPVPDKKMVEASGVDLETLNRGHQVFMTNCSRCHEQVLPEEDSDQSWHSTLPSVAWDTGLTQSDADAVMKYIKAAR